MCEFFLRLYYLKCKIQQFVSWYFDSSTYSSCTGFRISVFAFLGDARLRVGCSYINDDVFISSIHHPAGTSVLSRCICTFFSSIPDGPACDPLYLSEQHFLFELRHFAETCWFRQVTLVREWSMFISTPIRKSRRRCVAKWRIFHVNKTVWYVYITTGI